MNRQQRRWVSKESRGAAKAAGVEPELWLISVPAYDGKIYSDCVLGLTMLAGAGVAPHIALAIDIRPNEFITHTRNRVANQVLRNKQITGILFIDSDTGFTPQDARRLFEVQAEGHPVVGANYCEKRINWALVERAVREGMAREDLASYAQLMIANLKPLAEGNGTLAKADYLGMGLALVHRSALETLVEQNLVELDGEEHDGEGQRYEFFRVGKTEIGYMGTEDVYFYRKLQAAGIDVICPLDVRPAHVGVYRYQAAPMQASIEELRAQAAAEHALVRADELESGPTQLELFPNKTTEPK